MSTCSHCGRAIVFEDGVWVDPLATGDDAVWRETCDAHDTFTAEHVPDPVAQLAREIADLEARGSTDTFLAPMRAELDRLRNA